MFETHARQHLDHRLHQHHVGGLVLDVEHHRLRRGQAGLRCARVGPRRVGHVQSHREAAAAAGLAVDVDAAAHRLDDLARNHQADARALDALALAAEPVEWLEQLADLLHRQADAGVVHLDAHASFCQVGLQFEVHRTVRAVVLERIRGQVHHHLLQARRVGLDPDRRAGIDPVELHFGSRRLLRQQVDGNGQHLAGIDRHHHVEAQVAGLDLRQVHQVGDHRQQPIAGALDVQHLIALRLGGSTVRQQQLRKTEHRVERRAQLVADLRQEARLGQARQLGGLLLAQRRLHGHLMGQVADRAVPADLAAVVVAHRLAVERHLERARVALADTRQAQPAKRAGAGERRAQHRQRRAVAAGFEHGHEGVVLHRAVAGGQRPAQRHDAAAGVELPVDIGLQRHQAAEVAIAQAHLSQ